MSPNNDLNKAILSVVRDGQTHSLAQIREAVSRGAARGVSAATSDGQVSKALTKLVADGQLFRPSRGSYQAIVAPTLAPARPAVRPVIKTTPAIKATPLRELAPIATRTLVSAGHLGADSQIEAVAEPTATDAALEPTEGEPSTAVARLSDPVVIPAPASAPDDAISNVPATTASVALPNPIERSAVIASSVQVAALSTPESTPEASPQPATPMRRMNRHHDRARSTARYFAPIVWLVLTGLALILGGEVVGLIVAAFATGGLVALYWVTSSRRSGLTQANPATSAGSELSRRVS